MDSITCNFSLNFFFNTSDQCRNRRAGGVGLRRRVRPDWNGGKLHSWCFLGKAGRSRKVLRAILEPSPEGARSVSWRTLKENCGFNFCWELFLVVCVQRHCWLYFGHLEMDSFVLPLAADQLGFGAVSPLASSSDGSGAPMSITGEAGALFQRAEAKPDSLRSLGDYAVTQSPGMSSTKGSFEPDFSSDDDLSVLANHTSQLREKHTQLTDEVLGARLDCLKAEHVWHDFIPQLDINSVRAREEVEGALARWFGVIKEPLIPYYARQILMQDALIETLSKKIEAHLENLAEKNEDDFEQEKSRMVSELSKEIAVRQALKYAYKDAGRTVLCEPFKRLGIRHRDDQSGLKEALVAFENYHMAKGKLNNLQASILQVERELKRVDALRDSKVAVASQ